MSDTTLAAESPAPLEGAGAPRTPGRVTVGGRDYTIERPSGRKASSAFRLLKAVSGTVKDVTKALGQFEREYARDHAIELDRVQARVRYPARPLLRDDGEPIVNAETGELVMVSPIDSMTEEDWQKSGQVLRRPMAPSMEEKVGVALELAIDEAEDEVYKVLALFTLTNAEVAQGRKDQTLDQDLAARADVLLDDGGLDELMELAVVIAETVDDQFRRKLTGLGGRVGKLKRLLGLNRASMTDGTAPTEEAPQTAGETSQTEAQTPSSNSRPTSSTDSPADTPDGPPTSSSTPTTPSSSPSAPASTASAS